MCNHISDKSTIGSNVTLGYNVIIENYVVIGDNVEIGHNVIIRENVQIGDNCKILDGVILGKMPAKASMSATTGAARE
ncbi:MAG: N-acetyltransferase, partial [Synergistaceae bacterium]|nr:N-acetyltransferase [Synergistaceae bacterium]